MVDIVVVIHKFNSFEKQLVQYPLSELPAGVINFGLEGRGGGFAHFIDLVGNCFRSLHGLGGRWTCNTEMSWEVNVDFSGCLLSLLNPLWEIIENFHLGGSFTRGSPIGLGG